MPLIRTKRVAGNAGGRAGCEVQSPYTAAIFYVSVEHGWLYVRDYGGAERAKDGPVTLIPSGGISACFANNHEVCVTVAGFPPDTDQSGMDTYLLEMAE